MARLLIRSGVTLGVLLAGAVAAIALPPETPPLEFPGGARFAFTIVDDTDMATLENVRPVYDFLAEQGLRTTKTVWVLPGLEQDIWSNRGDSLADPEYLAFVRRLQDQGFEIASHGARGGTSTRPDILDAMEQFKAKLGGYPRIHVNHDQNRDNVYWGTRRLTIGPLQWLYGWMPKRDIFAGDDPASPLFWGDFLRDQIPYVVNFSFSSINLWKINPSVPYHLPQRGYVQFWFHTSDGGKLETFNELLSPANLDRLQDEGGVCIVYTHFGKGFLRDGHLDPDFVDRISDLASRPGWFVPASELLDYLRAQRESDPELSWRERARLELWWMIEKVRIGSS